MATAAVRPLLAFIGVIAVSIGLLFFASDTRASHTVDPNILDPNFEPTLEVRLCNALPAAFGDIEPSLQGNPNCADDLTPGGHPDFSTIFNVPTGDYNFSTGGFGIFIDGDFQIASDADIPDGTIVGGLRSDTRLGLQNSACNNQIFPDFIFYDGTTNTANTVDPLPEGTSDRFSVLANDADLDGIADADSPAVTGYPSFLNTFFKGARPHARYVGLSQVPPGGDWVILQFLIFPPGALKSHIETFPNFNNHPWTNWDASRGWVNVIVLQDPTVVEASPSAIGDFCTPLGSTTGLLGVVGNNIPRLTAPSGGGSQLFQLWVQSLRDIDGDGYENTFDTCPFDPNSEDARSTKGPDSDNIDSACDANPGSFDGDDADGDGFSNAQDNCPQVFNDPNADSEAGAAQTNYDAVAPDGGPGADGVGDACDPDDTVADGDYEMAIQILSKCIGGTDSDGDGWCTDLDPDDADPSVTGEPHQDHDLDGWRTWDELFIGTDPLFDCSKDGATHDAWPADFDLNRKVNILDVVQITPPVFGSSTGDPNYSVRKDLKPDGTINILDVVLITPPVFGSSCNPA